MLAASPTSFFFCRLCFEHIWCTLRGCVFSFASQTIEAMVKLSNYVVDRQQSSNMLLTTRAEGIILHSDNGCLADRVTEATYIWYSNKYLLSLYGFAFPRTPDSRPWMYLLVLGTNFGWDHLINYTSTVFLLSYLCTTFQCKFFLELSNS